MRRFASFFAGLAGVSAAAGDSILETFSGFLGAVSFFAVDGFAGSFAAVFGAAFELALSAGFAGVFSGLFAAGLEVVFDLAGTAVFAAEVLPWGAGLEAGFLADGLLEGMDVER